MMHRVFARGWKHTALAVALAYALVLQALLLSLGGAFHAAAAAQAQGILCLQNGTSAPDDPPAEAHDGLCCILSCHSSGPAGPLPASSAAGQTAPLAAAVSMAGKATTLRPASKVLPVGSRAPPRLG